MLTRALEIALCEPVRSHAFAGNNVSNEIRMLALRRWQGIQLRLHQHASPTAKPILSAP